MRHAAFGGSVVGRVKWLTLTQLHVFIWLRYALISDCFTFYLIPAFTENTHGSCPSADRDVGEMK